MEIKRYMDGSARLAETGKAALFEIKTASGETINLEVLRDHMPALVSLMLAVSREMGEIAPEVRPLKDTLPHQAARADSSEIRVRKEPPAGMWIYFRCGAVDISVPIDNLRTSEALGRALLNQGQA